MLMPWKPRGPNDPAPKKVQLAVYATEEDRNRVVISTLMTMPYEPYSTEASRIYMEGLMEAKLPGGYALVHTGPLLGQYMFLDYILKWTRTFNTENGMPYAWRTWEKSHYVGAYGKDGDRIAAGRSPCNRGDNLRDVIRRTMPDFMDGRFREKGVIYEE